MEEVKLTMLGQMDNTMDNTFESANRVYDCNGLCPTIPTMAGGNIEPKTIVAMRGRNPDIPSDRTIGSQTEQRLEPNSQGLCNTITSVQKDNMVLENSVVGTLYSGASEKFGCGYMPDICKTLKANKDVTSILIKQATKDGYIECKLGGVADLSYPNSETRRGRVQENGEVSPTITATETGICKIESIYRIRKLTPRECGRLMAVSDENINKILSVVSNSQAYKQFGNSIVVMCMVAMFSNLNIQNKPRWSEIKDRY